MTVLKNIVAFTNLVVGVPQVKPHLLSAPAETDVVPLIPDLVAADKEGFIVVADATNVTVTRTATAQTGDMRVYLEHWHTIEAVTPVSPLFFQPPVVPFYINGDGEGAVSVEDAAMYYGLTGTDYPAPIAQNAAVPFPQAGPATDANSTVNSGSTTKTLSKTGVYRITWAVCFNTASQLQVKINSATLAHTVSNSGGDPGEPLSTENTNDVLISVEAGDVLSIVNPNAAALTVTAGDEDLEQEQAPSLTVEYLGPAEEIGL